MTATPPDHSTLSRTRRRLDIDVHNRIFNWILAKLAVAGLLEGKTIGVDATPLEANAALRTLVKRDDGQGYEAFLIELAKAEGIETPSREISKMKDGATDMAHKVEHAVDMAGGAVVAVTLHGGTTGDTTSLGFRSLTRRAEPGAQQSAPCSAALARLARS